MAKVSYTVTGPGVEKRVPVEYGASAALSSAITLATRAKESCTFYVRDPGGERCGYVERDDGGSLRIYGR